MNLKVLTSPMSVAELTLEAVMELLCINYSDSLYHVIVLIMYVVFYESIVVVNKSVRT